MIRFRNPNVEKFAKIDETMLNDRQKKAVEYLKVKQEITTGEYMELTGASLRTARRDLLDLKSKRIMRFVGSLKTGHYALMAL